MKPTIKITSKSVGRDIGSLVRDLTKKRALVGWPEEKSGRPGEQITNAQLAYIHSNGSPVNNTPARRIVEPAIEASGNNEPIVEELKEAALAALDGKKEETLEHLDRAGQEAENAARAWFTDARNGWAENSRNPLGPFLAEKLSEKLGRKITPDMSYYDVKQSCALGDGEPFPLIFSGELRKALTHIVSDGK